MLRRLKPVFAASALFAELGGDGDAELGRELNGQAVQRMARR
jgi:hypothetical protein